MPEPESGNVGIAIRQERLWLGLTSAELAGRASLSPAYLSRIEKGNANPSLNVLSRIAGALGLPREVLLKDGDKRTGRAEQGKNPHLKATVVRRLERKSMRTPNSSVIYELLTPDLQRNLQFIMAIHTPGETVQEFAHEGEESILCLSGSTKVVVGGEEFVLEPGDCVCFDSSVRHSATAIGNEPGTIVSAQTPPSF